MKISAIFAAAGMVIAAMGVSTSADARPRDGYHDQGRHHGMNNRRDYRRNRYHRPVRHCRTEWRNHHRIRVCR